jgi:hypothetical protein
MKEELYRKVYIKDASDLPKEGIYYCHFKIHNSTGKLKKWSFTKGSNDYYWLRDIDWYLQPIEQSEGKAAESEKSVEEIAKRVLQEHMKKHNLFHTNNVLVINAIIEAMEEYRQQPKVTDELREELKKYHKYYCERVFGNDNPLAINPEYLTIDEYLKSKTI